MDPSYTAEKQLKGINNKVKLIGTVVRQHHNENSHSSEEVKLQPANMQGPTHTTLEHRTEGARTQGRFLNSQELRRERTRTEPSRRTVGVDRRRGNHIVVSIFTCDRGLLWVPEIPRVRVLSLKHRQGWKLGHFLVQ